MNYEAIAQFNDAFFIVYLLLLTFGIVSSSLLSINYYLLFIFNIQRIFENILYKKKKSI